MPKKRIKQKKQLKPRLHIFCEGAKTEPNYLTGYIQQCFPGTKLIFVESTNKNTPRQLVDEAAKSKENSPLGDVFWVVYDRESEHKYSAALHAEAEQKAKAHKIEIVLTNVCFEVWLLLHFSQNITSYSSYDDLLKRSKLKTFLPGYEKGDRRIFDLVCDRISEARVRAARMNKKTMDSADPSWNSCHQWNPYTRVHELLQAIDEFGQEYT